MVVKSLSCLCLLVSSFASAYDFHLIDLNELSINYRNYAIVNDKARNDLIYPESPKEGIDIGMKFDVLNYGYLDSTVESLTTDSQYRAIGLQLRLGIRFSDFLEAGYWHHSQHLIDSPSHDMDKYPSEDALELRLYIYRAKDPRPSVF